MKIILTSTVTQQVCVIVRQTSPPPQTLDPKWHGYNLSFPTITYSNSQYFLITVTSLKWVCQYMTENKHWLILKQSPLPKPWPQMTWVLTLNFQTSNDSHYFLITVSKFQENLLMYEQDQGLVVFSTIPPFQTMIQNDKDTTYDLKFPYTKWKLPFLINVNKF